MTLARSCARCGSTNVQSLSMVHASGTTQTQTTGLTLTSTAYGNGQSGLGVGSYQGSSVHQNALAAAAAPPDIHRADRRQEWINTWKLAVQVSAVVIVIGFLGYNVRTESGGYLLRLLLVFGFPALLVSVIGWQYHKSALEGDRDLDRRAQKPYDVWTRSFLCLSCGDIGVTAEAHQPARRTLPTAAPVPAAPVPTPPKPAVQLSSAEDLGFKVMPGTAFQLLGANNVLFTLPGILLKWSPHGTWQGLGRTPVSVPRPTVGHQQIYGVLGDDGLFYVSVVTVVVGRPVLPSDPLTPPPGWQGPSQPTTAALPDAVPESLDLPPGSYTIHGDVVRFTVPGMLFRQEADGQLTPLGRTPVDVPRPTPGTIQPYGLRTDDGRSLASVLTHDGEALADGMTPEQVATQRAIGGELPAAPAQVVRDLDRLAQLGRMKQEGLLTEEEFTTLKGRLLAEAAQV